MTKLSRRNALKGMVLGGSLAAFGGMQTVGRLMDAQAEPEPERAVPERHYIFCYFQGGWDILLSLDPRDPRKFGPSNMSTTRIQPAYDLLSFDGDPLSGPTEALTFGPFMGELNQRKHLERMTVIRGMSMDTLTHDVGRRRFITGRPPSGLKARGSSADAWLAATLSKDEPLPNLSVRAESFNDDLPNFASAVRSNSSDDLLRVLSNGSVQMSSEQERQLDALLSQSSACSQAQQSKMMRDSELSRSRVREMLDKRLDSLFDFRQRTPEMEAIRDQFGIRLGQTSGPNVQAAIAAIAITNQVSRCVSISITDNLDTHFDNWTTDQGPRQMAGFNSVAAIADHLAQLPYKGDPTSGDSWLDHTTIIGFSEFSRTPMLNGTTGRDHWLNNACFLMGGGIKGNQVIGASSDFGMYPQPVNLKTGELDESGEVVRPEHILRALYDEVGIEEEAPDLRVDALSSLLK